MGLVAGGVHEAALPLLEGIRTHLSAILPGELVAAIPARDLVFFAGTETPAALADLRKRVAELELEPGTGLWDGLMVWRDDWWQPFDG